jgi:translation elongation factor EF-1beta
MKGHKGVRMGKAMVIFKVSPEPEKIDSVEEALKEIKLENVKLQDLQRVPIGFGIEIIKVGYIVPDKTDGIIPAIEEAINKIDGLTQESEMEGATLIS